MGPLQLPIWVSAKAICGKWCGVVWNCLRSIAWEEEFILLYDNKIITTKPLSTPKVTSHRIQGIVTSEW